MEQPTNSPTSDTPPLALDYQTPDALRCPRCPRWHRWVKPAAWEIWLSIAIVFTPGTVSHISVPWGPGYTIGSALFISIAWVCALNAVVDFRRMSVPMRGAACIWFVLITWLAARTLHESFTTRGWANR